MTGLELIGGMLDVLPEGEYRATVSICRVTRNSEGIETANSIMLHQVADFVVAPAAAPEPPP